jgi:hypothetical protein
MEGDVGRFGAISRVSQIIESFSRVLNKETGVKSLVLELREDFIARSRGGILEGEEQSERYQQRLGREIHFLLKLYFFDY